MLDWLSTSKPARKVRCKDDAEVATYYDTSDLGKFLATYVTKHREEGNTNELTLRGQPSPTPSTTFGFLAYDNGKSGKAEERIAILVNNVLWVIQLPKSQADRQNYDRALRECKNRLHMSYNSYQLMTYKRREGDYIDEVKYKGAQSYIEVDYKDIKRVLDKYLQKPDSDAQEFMKDLQLLRERTHPRPISELVSLPPTQYPEILKHPRFIRIYNQDNSTSLGLLCHGNLYIIEEPEDETEKELHQNVLKKCSTRQFAKHYMNQQYNLHTKGKKREDIRGINTSYEASLELDKNGKGYIKHGAGNMFGLTVEDCSTLYYPQCNTLYFNDRGEFGVEQAEGQAIEFQDSTTFKEMYNRMQEEYKTYSLFPDLIRDMLAQDMPHELTSDASNIVTPVPFIGKPKSDKLSYRIPKYPDNCSKECSYATIYPRKVDDKTTIYYYDQHFQRPILNCNIELDDKGLPKSLRPMPQVQRAPPQRLAMACSTGSPSASALPPTYPATRWGAWGASPAAPRWGSAPVLRGRTSPAAPAPICR